MLQASVRRACHWPACAPGEHAAHLSLTSMCPSPSTDTKASVTSGSTMRSSADCWSATGSMVPTARVPAGGQGQGQEEA